MTKAWIVILLLCLACLNAEGFTMGVKGERVEVVFDKGFSYQTTMEGYIVSYGSKKGSTSFIIVDDEGQLYNIAPRFVKIKKERK